MNVKNILIYDKDADFVQKLMMIFSAKDDFRTELCTNAAEFAKLTATGGNHYYTLVISEEILFSNANYNQLLDNFIEKNPYTKIIVAVETVFEELNNLLREGKITAYAPRMDIPTIIFEIEKPSEYSLNKQAPTINNLNMFGVRTPPPTQEGMNSMSYNNGNPMFNNQNMQMNGGYNPPPVQNNGYPQNNIPQNPGYPPQHPQQTPPMQNYQQVPISAPNNYPPQNNPYPQQNYQPQQSVPQQMPMNNGYPQTSPPNNIPNMPMSQPPQMSPPQNPYPQQNMGYQQAPPMQNYPAQDMGMGVGFGKKGVITTVHSPKGGVGKSTITKELGGYYASKGIKTCIVDMDVDYGDIYAILDLRPVKNMVHWAADIKSRYKSTPDPERIKYDWDTINNFYLLQHQSGLYVLAAPTQSRDANCIGDLEAKVMLQNLKDHFDLILVDTGPNIKDVTFASFELADQIVIISNLEIAALSDIEQLMKSLSSLSFNFDKIKVVSNETSKEQEDIARETMTALGFGNVIGVIPRVAKVEEYNNKGTLMVTGPDNAFTVALKKIADILYSPYGSSSRRGEGGEEKTGMFGALKSFLFGKK